MIPPELLLRAYANGIFPMGDPSGDILWFSPDPRGIIPLEAFHVPHGLRRTLKRDRFDLKINSAFAAVISACSLRGETWITPTISESYLTLHHEGHAHSVEAYLDGELAGGLYGVAIGGAFFGESMFHTRTDASKVALHFLVSHLRHKEFALLDTQWVTPHLEQFGAVEISRAKYLARLSTAIHKDCSFL